MFEGLITQQSVMLVPMFQHMVSKAPWPPPIQCVMHIGGAELRPIPWPSFGYSVVHCASCQHNKKDRDCVLCIFWNISWLFSALVCWSSDDRAAVTMMTREHMLIHSYPIEHLFQGSVMQHQPIPCPFFSKHSTELHWLNLQSMVCVDSVTEIQKLVFYQMNVPVKVPWPPPDWTWSLVLQDHNQYLIQKNGVWLWPVHMEMFRLLPIFPCTTSDKGSFSSVELFCSNSVTRQVLQASALKFKSELGDFQYGVFLVQQLTSIIVVQQLFLWDPGGDQSWIVELESILGWGDLQMQWTNLSFVKKKWWLVLFKFLSSLHWPSRLDNVVTLLGYLTSEDHARFTKLLHGQHKLFAFIKGCSVQSMIYIFWDLRQLFFSDAKMARAAADKHTINLKLGRDDPGDKQMSFRSYMVIILYIFRDSTYMVSANTWLQCTVSAILVGPCSICFAVAILLTLIQSFYWDLKLQYHWNDMLYVQLLECELIQQYLDGSWCYNSAAFIMEIKYKLMTSIKHLQTPWDPGGIDLMNRLGGKPNLKNGGMSGMYALGDCQVEPGCQPEIEQEHASAYLFKLGRTWLLCLHARMGHGPCKWSYILWRAEGGGHRLSINIYNCSSSL
ncbi:unnamed protein product [Urochloa humidicola]